MPSREEANETVQFIVSWKDAVRDRRYDAYSCLLLRRTPKGLELRLYLRAMR